MKKIMDLFHFNKTERNGIFVLLIIGFMCFALPFIFQLINKKEYVSYSEFDKKVAAFANLQIEKDSIEANKKSYDYKQKYNSEKFSNEENKSSNKYKSNYKSKYDKKEDVAPVELKLQNFDPNSVSPEVMRELGLTDRAINTLIKFKKNGGRFYAKEDLAKIYGIPASKYEELAPYIDLQSRADRDKEYAIKKEERQAKYEADKLERQEKYAAIKAEREAKKSKWKAATEVRIDINTSTAMEWQQIQGIGPYYADKIIEYRRKLGGFASIETVGTTYGLPDSVFQKIKPQLTVSDNFDKIKINTATAEELSSHLLINWKESNAIVGYRKNYGAFKSVDDLKKLVILDPTKIEKMKPYLDFEE